MDVPGGQRQLTHLPGSSKRLKRTRDYSTECRAFFMCQSDQTAPRFRKKHVRATKTPRVFAENMSGRPKRLAISQKTRQDDQNAVGWCSSSAKAAATQKGFLRSDMILPNTRTGGASPTQKQPPQQPLTTIKDWPPTLTRVHHSTPTGVRHSTKKQLRPALPLLRHKSKLPLPITTKKNCRSALPHLRAA